ncbi:N-acyl homoserine lactonase family protein [Falsiroseomonas selenitidurans]|uniref:N-acyl homoserine lactonase family protein n=1 Tax=Falsiroseomonas selenitidurans TaxID=2716335 RepID=A0ABX1E5C9_9PROT|nr:N-acyl homoserine lactonase family protein [Falsiroseomonas selenitidurans]NKC32181.1 N-acyl homoserine lactonase family protein [Falsiroseomonas selenitidurans]
MWQVLALRYARHEPRTVQANFMMPVPDAHEQMPMDYFVWLLRGPGGREVLVDTGYTAETGARRGRSILRPVDAALRAVGSDPAAIRDVVITHLHYDHAGNLDLFPNATFHIQDREVAFATGRHMCGPCLRSTFEVEDVVRLIRAVYAERVQFHDGEGEVAPGLTLHGIGGHSDGLQMVRAITARGPLVIAGDASHYYANMRRQIPFPIVFDVGAMVQGWRKARALAGGDESLVIPGHDPLVRAMFPVSDEDPESWRLDLPPYS